MKSVILVTLALFQSCSANAADAADAPIAPQHAFEVTSPNGARSDPYYWIRDDERKNPEMLAYLNAENAYFKSKSDAWQPLTDKLYQEIVGRIKKDDSTVPYRKGRYFYSTRFTSDGEYGVHVRRPVGGGIEQVMLDGNKEGKGTSFFEIASTQVSPNEKLLAYLEDRHGRRQYSLKFRDLKTGHNLKDEIHGLSPTVAWANDNKTVFYIENDPVTLLSVRVRKHVLGSDSALDPVVYEEKDNSYYLSLLKTGDDRYIEIVQQSTETSGILIIDADHPDSMIQPLAIRTENIKFSADHIKGRWIIRTDWNAPNYRLMYVADNSVGDLKKWQTLFPYDDHVFIEAIIPFKNYLAINERSDGILRIRVVPWAHPDKAKVLQADEPAYTENFEINEEQNSTDLRYNYSSLTTPDRVYSVNIASGKRTLLKQRDVPGGFKSANYQTERVWAVARDGVRVPVSLVYRKGFKRDGTAPLYQYGYGSYGLSTDPFFESTIISLLDRGFVFAIAHVRGGQEMGRAWYEDGKLQHKVNTFNDFLDVTDYLVAQHYAAKDKVFAVGGSAGGLLMGAIANRGGEKYRGIIAQVPFVDVVTTMLDESIPLTTNEFNEWGNPKEKVAYAYMLSYSPYDNVGHKNYPAMLVTTGLNDSQVQYYEPTKWVARLRAMKTDQNPLYLKINMDAGHGGNSGRFARQVETAEEYGFILHELGMRD